MKSALFDIRNYPPLLRDCPTSGHVTKAKPDKKEVKRVYMREFMRKKRAKAKNDQA
jgi:hypothetical protein